MVKTFKDLLIWQKSIKLVSQIYEITGQFPDIEKYGIISQMRRSSVSIPSNIAEGFGRKSKGDFKRFLSISNGSLFELQTLLEIALNINILSENNYEELYSSTREVERMLSSFIQTLTIK